MFDLSKFVWEKEYNWWIGNSENLTGSPVEIRIQAQDENDTDKISAAEYLFEKILSSENDIRNFAAAELLESDDDIWGETGKPDITHEDFAGRIRLESVGFNEDGSSEAAFDDGNLFWGHIIIVQIDKDFQFEYADIAG